MNNYKKLFFVNYSLFIRATERSDIVGTSSTFSTSNSHVKYNIKIYQNWQSVEGNYSNVTVKVNFWRTNSGYQTYGTGVVYCKINGTTYSASVSPSQKITSSGITLFNRDVAVGHNADGSKYLDTSAWISMDTPLSSSEQWYGEWLTTIPRASSISSISGGTLGNSVTVNISRASDSFTHKVDYVRPDGEHSRVGENITTSCTFTPALSDCDFIPNSTSGTAKIYVYTYSGSTYIGSSSKDFTVYVPDNIIPTINSVNLAENTAGIENKFGCYVQGKSTIKGIVSASGVYSSTIKNYEIKINGQSFNQSNFTTNPLTGSGNCVVKITDTRNRTVSTNIAYTAQSYSNPTINNFSLVRCNQDGTENDEGAYAKCMLKANISSVNNRNDKAFQLLYKKLTDSNYTTINLPNNSYYYESTQIIEADINSEYEFIFKISYYFRFAEKSLNLGTAFTLVDYNASGRSVAFGRVSTANSNEKKMQIKMDTEIEGNLRINNKTIFDLIYPIGSIYLSVNSTNPKNLFGGTWIQWGSGRVPVCVNTSNSKFNSVEKTGGAETHKLTVSQIPSHGGHIPNASYAWGDAGEATYVLDRNSGAVFQHATNRPYVLRAGNEMCLRSNNEGGNGDHNNLQPYITCYMWKRTA